MDISIPISSKVIGIGLASVASFLILALHYKSFWLFLKKMATNYRKRWVSSLTIILVTLIPSGLVIASAPNDLSLSLLIPAIGALFLFVNGID